MKDLKLKRWRIIYLGEEKQTFYLVRTEIDVAFPVLLG